MTPPVCECEALRTRIEELEYQLSEATGDKHCQLAPLHWRLTRRQGQIAYMLAQHGAVSHRNLWAALYPDPDTSPESNTISVQIFHLRNKLRPHGVVIRNIHSWGYQVEPDSHAKLKAGFGI